MNCSEGWMSPEMNWARKLDSYSSWFWRVEDLDRLGLTAEHLHDAVPGVHLLDVAVQGAGALPLRGELLLRALRDLHRDDDRDG